MNKPSKTTLIRKLDKVCSQIVRARGYCERCHADDFSKLQAAHVYSRKFHNVRWDIETNILCLCAKCHFEFHAKPLVFAEWLQGYLGDYKYTLLNQRARAIKQYKLYELEDLLASLTTVATGE
jgi:hypothetical protein